MGFLFGDSESTCTAHCPDVKCPELDIPDFQCPNMTCPKMELPSIEFCGDVISGEKSCAEIKFPQFNCEPVKCPEFPAFPHFQCPFTKCSELPMNCPQCFDNSIGLVIMVTVLVSLLILAILIFKIIESNRQSSKNVRSDRTTEQAFEMPAINQLANNQNRYPMNGSERMPQFVVLSGESQPFKNYSD